MSITLSLLFCSNSISFRRNSNESAVFANVSAINDGVSERVVFSERSAGRCF